MKDIHDFAAASLPGVMLEVMVLKKQMEPEVLAEVVNALKKQGNIH